MIKIEFNFSQDITLVQNESNDIFQSVINKFLAKYPKLDQKSLTFLANGRQLDPNSSIESQISKINKENGIVRVLVDLTRENINDILIDSKEVICPHCKESCRIKIEKGRFILFDCDNNHDSSTINIIDFPQTQKVNLSKIICDDCKKEEKNMGLSYKHNFYKCLTCQNNVCLTCEPKHDPNHNLIKYDQKNFICPSHNDSFIKYCKDCKINLCLACDDEHQEHNTIFFGNLLPKVKELKKIENEIKKEIEEFNNNIKDIINIFNNMREIIYTFGNININIINQFNPRNKNYKILENIKEITNNNDIYKKIKSLNYNQNLKEKILGILELYNEIKIPILNNNELINNKDNVGIDNDNINEVNISNNICNSKINNSDNNSLNKEKSIFNNSNDIDKKKDNNLEINNKIIEHQNELILKYETENKYEIKIFSKTFVKNNENNCHFIFKNKKFKLCEELKLENNSEDFIEIKLIETKAITDMSNIFKYCTSLPDISTWDTSNVTNMSGMFGDFSSLKELSDISKWNTSKVINMSYMFYNCRSLKSLPDISKWDTSNVVDMSYMFKNCGSLISLPDISKWNTLNVNNMIEMFRDCESLEELPDISKWNTKNVINMSYMFYNCKLLKKLPDISKWNVSNVNYLNNMFEDCSGLISMPDISNWDTKGVIKLDHMFYNCKSLKGISLPYIQLPNIYKITLEKI